MILHRQFGIHPLELCVLGFNVAQPLHVRSFHAAVLGLSYVVSRIGNSQLTAEILDLRSSLNLLQRRNDLALGEFTFAHQRPSWG